MSDSDDDDGASRARDAALARTALTARALSFFRRLPFFSSTPLSSLQSLAAVAQHYVVGREEVVVQQGASCEDGLFFVAKGAFRVVQELPVHANVVDEAAAARLFALPALTHEAATEQQQRIQAAAERHQQRLHALDASPYASQASLHSTFLTTQSRSAQSLVGGQQQAQQQSQQSQQRRGHPDGRRPSGSFQGTYGSGAMELPSVHEHGRHVDESMTMSDSDSYTDLSAYDSHAESKQQHAQQRATSRGHASALHKLASQHQQQQQVSVPLGVAAAPVPPAPKSSVIVGSRFLEVNQLGPYAVFGEVGVMMQCPRTASVISRTSGGELFAITKFDFLRLQTRRALHQLRAQAASSYRSVEELQLELDDSEQWEQYKQHLLAVSRDRNVGSHKLHQMPVFESVPVRSFALRLPKLRDQLETNAEAEQLQQHKRGSARKDHTTTTAGMGGQRAPASPYSAAHSGGSLGASVAAASSPRAGSRRAVHSYNNGSALNIVERYSSRRAISTGVDGGSSGGNGGGGAHGGSHTERSGKKKGVKLSAHSGAISAR